MPIFSLKFKLKKVTSRRAFVIYLIVSILITVSSVFVLSNLITDLTEKANEDMAQRNFIKKQEFLSQEFSKLLEQENRIKHLLKISNASNLASNLKVLSSVQSTNLLIVNNWLMTVMLNLEQILFLKK
jgi:hypothetical protein